MGGWSSAGWRGYKGEKKWDNCNSIINKIYLKIKNLKIKKLFKIGEFLCSHFNIEDGKNIQHFWHIMLNYFKKGKNATEMQKTCAV